MLLEIGNAPILDSYISGFAHQVGGGPTGERAPRETLSHQGCNLKGIYWIWNKSCSCNSKNLSN